MAEASRFLCALKRITDTARKINPHPTQPIQAVSNVPSILKSLPQHAPLLPLLVSYDIPVKLAKECAGRYDRYATQLRSDTETKLLPYLVNRRRNQPARVYTLFLDTYRQALRRWAQSILNATLKSLKRDCVELQNWDVTHPAPLWIPPQPDPCSAFPSSPKKPCPLSSAPAPYHAFPTTYPPVIRPPFVLPPVEWYRTPSTLSDSPSTSATDLDSLCLRFTKSLVIDENPTRSPQTGTSIFSLPATRKDGNNISGSRAKPLKARPFKPQHSHKLPTLNHTSIASPHKTAMSRQLPVPPSFPLSSPKIKSTSRKANAPLRVFASEHASMPHQITLTSPSPLNTTTAGGLDTYTYPDPSAPPLHLRPSLESMLGRTTRISQFPPYPFVGPATPPALLSDLFPEPVMAPSTPVDLSPGSSLVPATDPFTQFQSQSNYLLDASLVSLLDYSGSTSFSKSASDASLRSDNLACGIPAPVTFNSFESGFFNTHAVF